MCSSICILSVDGKGLTGHDQPGELLVKSPAVVLGYLNNPEANKEAFVTDKNGDRWLRTGDEVVFRKSANGHEHLFIVDRIKELIKVKVSNFQISQETFLNQYSGTPSCSSGAGSTYSHSS